MRCPCCSLQLPEEEKSRGDASLFSLGTDGMAQGTTLRGRVRLDIRENICTHRVVKHCNRLLREVTDALCLMVGPLLEAFG